LKLARGGRSLDAAGIEGLHSRLTNLTASIGPRRPSRPRRTGLESVRGLLPRGERLKDKVGAARLLVVEECRAPQLIALVNRVVLEDVAPAARPPTMLRVASNHNCPVSRLTATAAFVGRGSGVGEGRSRTLGFRARYRHGSAWAMPRSIRYSISASRTRATTSTGMPVRSEMYLDSSSGSTSGAPGSGSMVSSRGPAILASKLPHTWEQPRPECRFGETRASRRCLVSLDLVRPHLGDRRSRRNHVPVGSAGCLTEVGPQWPFSRRRLIESGPRWPFSRR
jgi:hypothetical protein